MDTAYGITASIVMIVLGIIVVIQMVLITALLVVLRNLVQEIRERADPMLTKATILLETANDIGVNLQQRSEQVSGRVADTTDVVGGSIEKISRLAQLAVAAPVIGGAAMTEGLLSSIRVWRAARMRRRESTVRPFDVDNH